MKVLRGINMTDMTVDELQKRKVEIEDQIKQLLTELETESKGYISYVDVMRRNDDMYYKSETSERGPITKVSINLRIVDTVVL